MKSAIHRLRGEFRALIMDEIRQTVNTEAAAGEELQHSFAAVVDRYSKRPAHSLKFARILFPRDRCAWGESKSLTCYHNGLERRLTYYVRGQLMKDSRVIRLRMVPNLLQPVNADADEGVALRKPQRDGFAIVGMA